MHRKYTHTNESRQCTAIASSLFSACRQARTARPHRLTTVIVSPVVNLVLPKLPPSYSPPLAATAAVPSWFLLAGKSPDKHIFAKLPPMAVATTLRSPMLHSSKNLYNLHSALRPSSTKLLASAGCGVLTHHVSAICTSAAILVLRVDWLPCQSDSISADSPYSTLRT